MNIITNPPKYLIVECKADITPNSLLLDRLIPHMLTVYRYEIDSPCFKLSVGYRF